MSRSLTRPTDSPRRRAARSVRRAFRTGTMVTPTRPARGLEPALDRGVGHRLHGTAHAMADEVGDHHRRHLDAPEVHAHDHDRPAGLQRLADGVGRLDDDPVQGLLEVHAARSARPRGSSGPCGGSSAGPAARARPDRWPPGARRRVPRPCASSPSQTRRRLARAWAARAGASRYHSSPMLSAAATSGASGRTATSRVAARSRVPRSVREPCAGAAGSAPPRHDAPAPSASARSGAGDHDGPGSGRPAIISRALASRLGGLGRVRGPHRLEAVPLGRARRRRWPPGRRRSAGWPAAAPPGPTRRR